MIPLCARAGLGHLAFVAFMVLGALLVLRWPKLAWVHLPAACWGVLIEFAGWICPLTPLENTLRVRGGAGPPDWRTVEREESLYGGRWG